MPGSQLAARIYTTNGAPVASPAPARAATHAAHPLIGARRAEVAETGREEERGGRGRLEWHSLAEPAGAPTTPLLDDTAAQPQTHPLRQIRSGVEGKKVAHERKSQSRARRITQMLKFNAKALENRSMSCFFFPLQIERVFFFSLSNLFEDTLKDYLLLA